MKIGFITGPVSRKAGGLLFSISRLSQNLSKSGDTEVKVFGLEDENSAQDSPEWLNITPETFAVQGPSALGYSSEMTRSLRRTNVDVMHTHGLWMYPSSVTSQWAKYNHRPYLITPHGMLDQWAVRNAHWKKKLAGWLYENAHLNGAACLHALCESEAESIRAYGLRNPICIIPNGMDSPKNEDFKIPEWKESFAGKTKVLFYLGRLHPKKGLHNLLRAWAMVRRNDCPGGEWKLVVAGWDQGGYESELKALVRQLDMDDSIHFVGPQFDLDKHDSYSAADAFVLPSASEGLPMVVLEAWAYGLPVLMTEQCNLPEGFKAQAALRIEGEPEGIAQGLAALFAMTDTERAVMSQQGMFLVSEHFKWTGIAEKMRSVYSWVLGRGSRPDCVHID